MLNSFLADKIPASNISLADRRNDILMHGERITKLENRPKSYTKDSFNAATNKSLFKRTTGFLTSSVSVRMFAVAMSVTAPMGLTLTGANAGVCTETAPGSGIFVCAGAAGADVTQALTPPAGGALVVSTNPGFGITTAAGNAIALSNFGGDTDITFANNNASAITGSVRGISAYNRGTGNLSITTNGTVTGNSGDGINANNRAASNDLTINAQAAVSGNTSGIDARNYGTGASSITTTSTVIGTSSIGIIANNRGTSLTINAQGAVTGTRGIVSTNQGSGALSITTTGTVTGTTQEGVRANSYGTDVTVDTQATVLGATYGVNVRNRGSGAASVTTQAVTGTVNHGIQVRNYGGSTNLTINAQGTVMGGRIGVFGNNSGTGSLMITAQAVTSTILDGISAINSAASTTITINAQGTVMGGRSGIRAFSRGTGNMLITTQSVTGGTEDGIYANGRDTNLTINAQGPVMGAQDGIDASSTTGAISVTTGGNVTGTINSGIKVESTTGVATVTVGVGHTVTGGMEALNSSAGTANVANAGSLNSVGTAASLFNVTAGSFTLNNTNATFGAIQSSIGSTTTFNNNATGTWTIDAAVSSLAGTDTINNAGTLNTSGAVTFNGIEAFNNLAGGIVSMQNGATGDVLIINGDFVGGGALNIDTVLNDGVVDTTDLLHVTGATFNTTTLNINVTGGSGGDTGVGPADGILVVQVDGASNGTFVLGAPVTIGAFNYTLNKADGQNWFLQSGALQNQIFGYSGLQLALQESMSSFRQRLSERVGGNGGQQITPVADLFDGNGAASLSGSGFWMKSVYSNVNATGKVTAGGTFANPRFNTTKTLVQIGYDKKLATADLDYFVVGVFGHYKSVDQRIRNSTGGSLSTTNADGYGGGITLTWLDSAGIYADFVGQITGYNVKVKDKVSGASASPNVVSYSVSSEVGFRFEMSENIKFVPQAQLKLGNAVVESFKDSSGVAVSTKNPARVFGRVGLGMEFALPDSGNIDGFTGYAVASLIHDFSNKYQLTAAGTSVTTKISPTQFEGVIGAKWKSENNLKLFGEFGFSRSMTGRKYSGFKGLIGARLDF